MFCYNYSTEEIMPEKVNDLGQLADLSYPHALAIESTH